MLLPSAQRGQKQLSFACVPGLLNNTIHRLPLGAPGKPQSRARVLAQVRDSRGNRRPLTSGAGSPLGSVGPEAGSGRKPPAAPRDRAPAPASSSSSSSTSSAAKGAGASPPVPAALFVPAARGRTRAHLPPRPPAPQPPPPPARHPPPGGKKKKKKAQRERARAGARGSRSRPLRQASSEHARRRARPSPARPLARNLLTARPGGAEPSRAERSGGRLSARGAPASLRLRLRPAERPPHRGSRSAGRRHPPAAARHCTAACDFRCSTLPGRSLGGGFFSRPPGAPPRLPPFPQGRFLGALPPPQRSGARAGRAGGRGKAAGPGPAWGAAGAGAAALFAPGAALLSPPR